MPENQQKSIYDLGLLERMKVAELFPLLQGIVRVPGGWIFEYTNTTLFVPYNKEFEPVHVKDRAGK